MSVQETKTRTKTRRRRRRDSKGKYRIHVRYEGHHWKEIETEDYGSFSGMFKKYKGKYQFWCGDSPPNNNGLEGYRLDSDISPEHEASTLKRYGRHKCWIDPTYRVDGRKVCLVYNASLGGQAGIFGAVGTVIGLAVAISLISEAQHKRWHDEGVAHTHHGRTRDGKLKVRRKKGRAKSRPGSFRTRRDGRKYRRRSEDFF